MNTNHPAGSATGTDLDRYSIGLDDLRKLPVPDLRRHPEYRQGYTEALTDVAALARRAPQPSADGAPTICYGATRTDQPCPCSTCVADRADRAPADGAPDYWKSQRKMIERAIIGLRDGWATRKDADDALAALACAPTAAPADGASIKYDNQFNALVMNYGVAIATGDDGKEAYEKLVAHIDRRAPTAGDSPSPQPGRTEEIWKAEIARLERELVIAKRGNEMLLAENDRLSEQSSPQPGVDEAMIDAYLTAQRADILRQEKGMGVPDVRAACCAGLRAALTRRAPQATTEGEKG